VNSNARASSLAPSLGSRPRSVDGDADHAGDNAQARSSKSSTFQQLANLLKRKGTPSRDQCHLHDTKFGKEHIRNTTADKFAGVPGATKELFDVLWQKFNKIDMVDEKVMASERDSMDRRESLVSLATSADTGDGPELRNLRDQLFSDENLKYGVSVPTRLVEEVVLSNQEAWNLPADLIAQHPDYIFLLCKTVIDELHIENKRGGKSVHHLMNFEEFFNLVWQLKQRRVPSALLGQPWSVIHPDDARKQAWDGVMMIFLLYTCFSVPFTLAFDVGSSIDMTTPFNIFDVSLDVLFMLDVILVLSHPRILAHPSGLGFRGWHSRAILESCPPPSPSGIGFRDWNSRAHPRILQVNLLLFHLCVAMTIFCLFPHSGCRLGCSPSSQPTGIKGS
jgi:hypothetical protein